MRVLAIIAATCAFVSIAWAEISLEERKKRGTYHAVAQAKIVLRCIDQYGQTVSNVTVSSGVTLDGNPETTVQIKGETDKDGCFAVEGRSNGELGYYCIKKGFYDTWEVKQLSKFSNVYVSNGRWEPYGLTNTVVLKRKVDPVAMYAADRGRNYTLIPQAGEPLGFDLTVGDWVSPHGRGKARDFDVTYIRDGEGRAFTSQELILSVRDPFAGFKKVSCDTYSAFKSPYRANTNAVYEKEIRFSFKRPGGTGGYIDGQMKADECIVLRTRTRLDEDGRLIGAHYGKIYGPLRFGVSLEAPGEMKILHYFNPNENDPNLEADTTKNLLNPRELGFAP